MVRARGRALLSRPFLKVPDSQARSFLARWESRITGLSFFVRPVARSMRVPAVGNGMPPIHTEDGAAINIP
jgi:hypothetical protein